MNELGDQIDTIFRQSHAQIWTAFMRQLARIDGIVVDWVMATRLGNGAIEPMWPVVSDEFSDLTENGLVIYRDINLRFNLQISFGRKYAKVYFPTFTRTSARERKIWNNSTARIPYLSPDYEITEKSIMPSEKEGKKLDRIGVMDQFVNQITYQSVSMVGWNVGDGIEKLTELLESRYTKYLRSLQISRENKDGQKFYEKYLRNRYPRVAAYIKENRTKLKGIAAI